LKEYEDLLQQTFATGPIPSPPAIQGEIKKQFSEEHYCKSVQRAIDYIFAGDIFQVNFTQRFQGELHEPPYQLYKRFRSINPAPYGCYLHFPDVIVASGSPERFILVRGRQVETRPIKGTRPRCGDLEKDQKSRAELLVSEKDRAELVMIIDLERNDLGRVCEIGSVRVPDLITLEEYPTVYHLVSTVVGTLRPGDTAIDLIKAAFPGGSITGAPKIRAMEIIDELEPVRRGIYTGSIGYIDFSGDADFNIVIRTFVIKGNQVYFQAGGGIVSDSSPQQEYQESLDKARALMRAFGCKEV
jgi:para-aminobenzoate synthetase component 1